MANGKKPKNLGSRLVIILIIKKWESTKKPTTKLEVVADSKFVLHIGILLKRKIKVNCRRKNVDFRFLIFIIPITSSGYKKIPPLNHHEERRNFLNYILQI